MLHFLSISFRAIMQRILISSEFEWIFMTHLVSDHNMFKVLLNSQATLYVFKIETLVPNIRDSKKASIGGLDRSQTAVSTV